MTVAAFLYDEYYCYGIKKSFAGLYDDEAKARNTIRGGRYNDQYLETMDLETLEMNKFVWHPIYDIVEKDDKQYLRLHYKEDGELIELENYLEPQERYQNEYGSNTPLYHAGYWDLENDD